MWQHIKCLSFSTRHTSSLVCMAGITYVYIDMIFVFYGYFFHPIFTAWLDVSAWLFGHMLFGVSYMHVFWIFAFALVQCKWACFTWKVALEIHSSSLSLSPMAIQRGCPVCLFHLSNSNISHLWHYREVALSVCPILVIATYLTYGITERLSCLFVPY